LQHICRQIGAGDLPKAAAVERQNLADQSLSMPCDIATLATDAPGSSHSATTCAFTAALYLCRVCVFSLVIVSTYE
jgi:hypothetical protein